MTSATRGVMAATALGAALVAATPANASGFKLGGGGDISLGRDAPIRGPFVAVGSGVALAAPSDDLRWSATGELGWTRGTRHFLGRNLGYLALAPTIDVGGGATRLDVAVLAGLVSRIDSPRTRVFTVGISAGVEARLLDRIDLGPVVKLRFGLWWIGGYVQASVPLVRDRADDAVARAGLELVL